MFKDKSLQELIELFDRRGVFLYHACQYIDFKSYLACYGVPSRLRLETSQNPFTAFVTDGSDRENGVWDKVFLNLTDFGCGFAAGHPGTPNPYGPIVLKLDPKALSEATDVAVCLRSAGGTGFDRQKESLDSVEQVDRLFMFPPSLQRPRSAWVKYRKELQAEFGAHATQPELSCTVASGVLPMEYVLSAAADPYSFRGSPLRGWVYSAMKQSAMRFHVKERVVPRLARKAAYGELAQLVETGLRSLRPLTESGPAELRRWATAASAHSLNYQFERFSTYLRNGTVRPLMLETAAHNANEREQRLGASNVHGSPELDWDRAEMELLMAEILDDQDDWARDNEGGWYYR